jgi:hypothetical protein
MLLGPKMAEICEKENIVFIWPKYENENTC